jgi:hypothetical protein
VKKLDYNHLTTGALTADASHLIGVVNDLIDLVNSQQEAIERLQEHVDHEARHISEPADDKPELVSKARYAEKLGIHDTHRTVTLRIPKGMTVGKAIWSTLDQRDENCLYRLFEQSDTDLQKALDEVQPNE